MKFIYVRNGCLIIFVIIVCFQVFRLVLLLLASLESETHPLGKNLHLMDWDGPCELIIYDADNDGHDGIRVLPFKGEPFSIDDRKDVKHNEQWVIVRAYNYETKQLCFFIIDKSFPIDEIEADFSKFDSIMHAHRIGPMNLLEFLDEAKRRNIQLNF